MKIKDFESMVALTRKRLRECLDMVKYDYREKMIPIKHVIGEAFSECGSLFEEETLVENLKEEFENWVDCRKREGL